MDVATPDAGVGPEQAAASGSASAPPAVGRAPPIFAYGVFNAAAFYRRLVAAPGVSSTLVDLKLLGADTVKIVVRDIETHRHVVGYLEVSKVEYHTFTPKHVKPLSFVLRGLDVGTNPEDILSSLRELGYPVRSIHRLYAPSGPRRALPLVRLLVEKGESLLNLTRLFGFRVKVENSRAPGALPQCHRCQRFGHHTDVCRSAPACVRCSLGHLTQECTATTRRCINCGGSHPANFRSCPVYKEELQRRKPKQSPPQPRHTVVRPTTAQQAVIAPIASLAPASAELQRQSVQPLPASVPQSTTTPQAKQVPKKPKTKATKRPAATSPSGNETASTSTISENKPEETRPTITAEPAPAIVAALPPPPPRYPKAGTGNRKAILTSDARVRAPAPSAKVPAFSNRGHKTDAVVSASAHTSEPSAPSLASTNAPSTSKKFPRSYAQAASRQTTHTSVTDDDACVVRDFLAAYDLRKVAQTFKSIRSRLETADIAERFMLLVEAAQVVGLL